MKPKNAGKEKNPERGYSRRGRIRSLPMKTRLFFACYSILLFSLLILGVAGIHWASGTVREKALSAYESAIMHTGERLDEYLCSLTDTVNLFCEDTLLSSIAYMRGESMDYSRISLPDLQKYSRELVFHCISNQLFDDVIICFPQKNSVVSTKGIWQLNWFFEDELCPQNLDSGLLWDALSEREAFFPGLKVKSYGQERNGMAFFRKAIATSAGKPLMSVIFWVNQATWKRHLDDVLLCEGQAVGLYGSDGALIEACLADGSFVQDRSLFEDEDWKEQKKYQELGYTLPQSGWKLRIWVPQAAILGEVRRIEMLIAVIVLAMAACGFFLSWKTVKASYRPMDQLYSTINNCLNVGDVPSQESMELAERRLIDIVSEQDKIRQGVEEHRTLLQYAALRHLLDGDETGRALAHQMPLAALGIKLPYHQLRTLALYGCEDRENCLGTARAISNSCAMRVYGLAQAELLVLLVNYQEEEELNQLVGHMSSMCRLICLSDARQGIDQICTAHAHMMETLDYHVIRNDVNVYAYDELPQMQSIRYPDGMERKLLGELRSGDVQVALETVEELLAMNNSVKTLQKLAMAVELTVLKTEDGTGELAAKLRALTAPEPYDSDQQTRYIRHMVEITAKYHSQSGRTRRPALTEKVQLYIDENICSEQLSLSTLASKFSVSTAYMSRYFKEQFGMGYLDYVTRKRVLMARDLLANGQHTVKETAQRVGFGNDAALRRAFKKVEGITPSDIQTEN